MHFDDILEIPVPVITPSMAKINDPARIDAIWEFFLRPYEDAFRKAMAEYDADPDPGAIKPAIPGPMRDLMGVLRAVKAGLDPEGSGWGKLRDAEKQARAELAAEQGTVLPGLVSDQIKALVGDIDYHDPYTEGVRDAYQLALAAEGSGKVETNDSDSSTED